MAKKWLRMAQRVMNPREQSRMRLTCKVNHCLVHTPI